MEGEIQPSRITYGEIPLFRRALAVPPRLARARNRSIVKGIRRLERTDARRRRHECASDGTSDLPAASTGRLSNRQVLLIDVIIVLIDAAFYYVTVNQILIESHIIKMIAAVLWTLPAPTMIIVAARHVGAAVRSLQDAPGGSAPRRGKLRHAAARAPLSAITLALLTAVTLLLLPLAVSRFLDNTQADGGVSPFLTVTAVVFGLIFVAVPALAVAVHAMHDPRHRADVLRYRRRRVKLASRHESAWLALLKIAQEIRRETGYVTHVVDEHLAVDRAKDARMGAHPQGRSPEGKSSPPSLPGRFAALGELALGPEPQVLADVAPLSFDWSALYPILSALEKYPPPPREDDEVRDAGTSQVRPLDRTAPLASSNGRDPSAGPRPLAGDGTGPNESPG
ncbi:hypothetical protein ACIBI3_20885 [Actinomadura luteofluorescens]|uniref:hypothetical protein n=1 Tax=Actinomadura luteofluorescens TaxID=46163 RepID=UPI00346D899E